jgi:hypothetical protein
VAGGDKWLIPGMTSSADHLQRHTAISDKLRLGLSQSTHIHGKPFPKRYFSARVTYDKERLNSELWSTWL